MNDPSYSSTLRTHWQFIPWGFVSQYDFEAPLSPDKLREAAKLLLTTVLPQAARSQNSLVDIRGRDHLRESLLQTSVLPPPEREELFWISGSRPVPSAGDSGEGELAPEPFELTYHTRFSHFEGGRHIAYTVERTQRGLEDFPPRELELILDPETTLSAIRLGFEIFEARFLSIFGFSPIATQLVQIEALPHILRLRIVGEALKRKDSPPLKSGAHFNALATFLKQLFDFDLMRDYQSKIA